MSELHRPFKQGLSDPRSEDTCIDEALIIQYIDIFRSFGDTIETTTRETSEEFLRIGARLSNFYERSSRISEIASGIIEFMSAQKITDALNGITSNLKSIEDRISKDNDSDDAYSVGISHILKALHDVNKDIDRMEAVAKNLNKVAVTIKIWSSPLGQRDAGFRSLSEEIKKIAQKIIYDTGRIKRSLKGTSACITEGLSAIRELKGSKKRDLQDIFSKTRKAVDSISAKKTEIHDASRVLSDWTITIKELIGEVVTSMQFEDITRQEFASINDIFMKTGDRLSTVLEHADGGGKHGPAHLMRQACGIVKCMRDKILDSREKLTGAINIIAAGLHGVGMNMSKMSDDIERTTGDAYDLEHSFLSDVESELIRLTENLSSIKEQSLAVGALSELTENIMSFIREIETIESEIDLIAFNSKIKAVHIGKRGAAMQVLADSVRDLSRESAGVTKTSFEKLTSIKSSMEDLDSTSSPARQDEKAVIEASRREMRELIHVIREVNGNVHRGLIDMHEMSGDLSREIDLLLSGNSVTERIEEMIDKIVPELDALIDDCTGLQGGAIMDDLSEEKIFRDLGIRQDDIITGRNLDSDDNVELF